MAGEVQWRGGPPPPQWCEPIQNGAAPKGPKISQIYMSLLHDGHVVQLDGMGALSNPCCMLGFGPSHAVVSTTQWPGGLQETKVTEGAEVWREGEGREGEAQMSQRVQKG